MERPDIPTILGGCRVLYYTRIDERHVSRKRTTSTPYGLAICDADGSGVFLFTCGEGWTTVFDSWLRTVAEAKRQAALEFEGVDSTWEQPPG